MKKFVSVMASALVIAGILTGCGSSNSNSAPSGTASSGSAGAAASAQETYKVAIVQPMSHTSLDQIRDTIVARLEASGKSIEITTENANGDSTALSTILSNCKAEGVDLVVPIATSTAQSAKTVFDGDGTPIVFAAVSDPTAAGLTGDDCQYITGVSNNIPAAEIVKLIFNFQPDCQKIGFLYTSSEANSVSTINSAKAYCDQEGIAYEEVSIANLSELQTAAETLISRGVDALYTGNDNSIPPWQPTPTWPTLPASPSTAAPTPW